MTTSLAVGTIRGAKSLGKNGTQRYVHLQCPFCLEYRWRTLAGNEAYKSDTCRRCYLEQSRCRHSNNWKGGRFKRNGYILTMPKEDNNYIVMADKDGYIPEHRLVMAEHIRRPLEKWEIVHHKNHIRDDNRLENLQLLPNSSAHIVDTRTREYIKKLERRVIILEAENILLKQRREYVD